MQATTKSFLAFLLCCLIVGDIALNACVEYDEFAGGTKSQTGILMYLAVQLMAQIMTFIMLFLMLSHTYPFQAGLFHEVFKEFRGVFAFWFLYWGLTLVLGIFRVNYIMEKKRVPYLMLRNIKYLAMSVVHKVVAVVFYSLVLDASTKLWNPLFYSRPAWVKEIRQKGSRSR